MAAEILLVAIGVAHAFMFQIVKTKSLGYAALFQCERLLSYPCAIEAVAGEGLP